MIVVSFEEYTPPPRYDETEWVSVTVEEAITSVGSWATIDSIVLDPPDDDPENPLQRNITTDQGAAPGLWYRLTFVDGNGDTSTPSSPILNLESANLYVGRFELKDILGLQDTTYADRAIDIAIESASRMCDGYKKTHFYPSGSSVVRYYSAEPRADSINIFDLNSLSSLELDFNYDGTYEESWTEGDEFRLGPVNATADGKPYSRVILKQSFLLESFRGFPLGDDATIKITGSWGWPSIPMQVKQATILLANRLLTRTRQAPLDVLVAVAGEAVSMAHLGSIDKDAKALLDDPFLGGHSNARTINLN